MNTRMIVPVILATVMLSTPVLADDDFDGDGGAMTPPVRHMQLASSQTPAERCTALEDQFDMAIKVHKWAPKATEAKSLRKEAGKLCASGKDSDGVAKLENALTDLGLKPKS